MIRVTIIGSGNVAEALAKGVARSEGLTLVEIAGRNVTRVEMLSRLTGSPATTIEGVDRGSDIYIISVKDGAIGAVAEMIRGVEGAVVHTAGAVSMDGVDGVLYPMQTFTSGRDVDMRRVPLFVEGAQVAREVAEKLSDTVVDLSSERRKALHLAAVFACNFTNAMYGATYDILQDNSLDLELFRPLVEETVAKAFDRSTTPREAQTGAARRGDTETMQSHIELLDNKENLIEIYKTISKYIWETSKKI